MFDALSERLEGVLSRLRSRGRLDADDVDEALREIRMALLEADVATSVVRGVIDRLREQLVGTELSGALDPGQQVIKAVKVELERVLGGEHAPLDLSGGPSPPVVLLAGLQGSGKTTAAAKLAVHLRSRGREPLLVACDLQRPAAVEQLKVLGEQVGVPVHAPATSGDPVEVAAGAREAAREHGAGVVIVDTAGRTTVDEEMMRQASEIHRVTEPAETLLVLDAMVGQEAVTVAESFAEAVEVTGVVLSKLDGDARGGAALSVAEVTGTPIKLASVGERPEDLEPFHPDRMAGRILGMGDVLTLIEKAEAQYTAEQAEEMEAKLAEGDLDLQDFLDQLQQLRNMGPLSGLLGMLPGVGKQLKDAEVDDDATKGFEAIIQSMTLEERRRPELLNGRRKRRIAAGSGRTPTEVNQLLDAYEAMRAMMAQAGGGKGGRRAMARAAAGGGLPEGIDPQAAQAAGLDLEALTGGRPPAPGGAPRTQAAKRKAKQQRAARQRTAKAKSKKKRKR